MGDFGYNRLIMDDVEQASPYGTRSPADRRPVGTRPARRCVAVSLLVLALAAPELWAGRAHPPKTPAMWAAAPVVAVPIAADPQVACPTESLGDCDFRQRFLIANEVVFHRNHWVAISLFGGLYGP